jgi:hypothetical protein
MVESIYSPLPKDTLNIRVLRPAPSADPLALIRCKSVICPLDCRPSYAHSYEALSYAWGASKNCHVLWIECGTKTIKVQVTHSLYSALVKLRDPYFERALWVDALCINQEDDNEKAHQVGAMARIYGLAQRVVVWLGDEGHDSELAFEELGIMASRNHDATASSNKEDINRVDESLTKKNIGQNSSSINAASTRVSDGNVTRDDRRHNKVLRRKREHAVLALLDRKYFRRMWVSMLRISSLDKWTFGGVCGTK